MGSPPRPTGAESLQAILGASGTPRPVVKTTIFLPDLGGFAR